MQVNLKETEIARAVELYLNRRGVGTKDMEVTIQFSMGKGSNGLKAQIDIEGDDNVLDEDASPVRLLESVQDEPIIKPGTVGALLDKHAKSNEIIHRAVEAGILQPATIEDPAIPFGNKSEAEAVTEDTPPWQGEEPSPEDQAVLDELVKTQAAEPSIADSDADDALEVPVKTVAEIAEAARNAPDEPVVEVAADLTLPAEQPAGVDGEEAQPEPVPEPAPKRKLSFGKKLNAEAAPAAEPVGVTAEPEAEPEPVAEVQEEAPAPAPVRRTAASLFKPKTPAA